jgi:predicted RNase H-like HicB family nuclease
MRQFPVLIERDFATDLFVGSVPGWPGAHSQGASAEELLRNLEEVVTMLLEGGMPEFESELVGIAQLHLD